MGFSDSSVGKESTCNAGDPGWIPGSGWSARKGIIGYPLQYFGASLVAQLVKNPPAMRVTWVRSLVGKIPGERKGYPLQYSGLENSTDYTVHEFAKSQTRLTFTLIYIHTHTLFKNRNVILHFTSTQETIVSGKQSTQCSNFPFLAKANA